MSDVFLFYAHADGAFDRQLHTALLGAGKGAWIDLRDIPAGLDWREEIEAGIDADNCVFVVSSAAVTSKECAQFSAASASCRCCARSRDRTRRSATQLSPCTTNAMGGDTSHTSARLAKVLAMQVNMHDAKTRLSELVAAAEQGEDVLIARNGRPAVRLVAVVERHPAVRLGILAGEIELGADFDDPLPGFDPYIR